MHKPMSGIIRRSGLPAEDYVARIRDYSEADLKALLEQVKEGVEVAGWPAGKAFEHLILRAFETEGAYVRYPYEVKQDGTTIEQIDGAVYHDGLACLVESKDYANPIKIDPIAKLANQLSRRPFGTLGLVFARSDFTEPAKTLARYLHPLNVLLWEFGELQAAVVTQRLCAGLKLKFQRAVEFGVPDYDIRADLL